MKQISYKIPQFPFSFPLWHNKQPYEGPKGKDDGYYTIQILFWYTVLVAYVFNVFNTSKMGICQ